MGFDSSHFIRDWNITPIRVPLTFLRITFHTIKDLLAIMATPPMSTTLRQLHVKLRDNAMNIRLEVPETKIAFCMSSLCTFTFVKALRRQFFDEWTLIDALTSSTVMPVLQRAKLIVALHEHDLNRIDRAALFNDHRCVDVQYAFILNSDLSHTGLDQRIPRGSRFHPRSITSATFVKRDLISNRPYAMPEKRYVSCVSVDSFPRACVSQTPQMISFVLAGLRFGRPISFVVHFAVGLQRIGSTIHSRQEDLSAGSIQSALLDNDSQFVSSRSNGHDQQ